MSRYELIKEHSYCPHVDLGVVLIVQQLLWRDIIWRTTLFNQSVAFRYDICHTEIYESNIVILFHHDVFWFDISMHYTMCVTIVDSVQELTYVM